MRLAWLGLLATCQIACSSSIYGTAPSESETSEEPTIPESENESEAEKPPAGDAGTDASTRDEAIVSVRVNGMKVAVTKGAAIVANGALQIHLRENPNTLSQPTVVFIVGRTGSGCAKPDGGGSSQMVLWYPLGIGQGPTYQAPLTATCGLTITRADMTAGGRAAGAFDGDVKDAAKNAVDHVSVTFDVPVRSSLQK